MVLAQLLLSTARPCVQRPSLGLNGTSVRTAAFHSLTVLTNSAAFTPSSFCANSLPDLVFVLTEVKLQSGYELEFLLCRGEKRDGALYPLAGRRRARRAGFMGFSRLGQQPRRSTP
jgi:hypothetical protein